MSKRPVRLKRNSSKQASDRRDKGMQHMGRQNIYQQKPPQADCLNYSKTGFTQSCVLKDESQHAHRVSLKFEQWKLNLPVFYNNKNSNNSL